MQVNNHKYNILDLIQKGKNLKPENIHIKNIHVSASVSIFVLTLFYLGYHISYPQLKRPNIPF